MCNLIEVKMDISINKMQNILTVGHATGSQIKQWLKGVVSDFEDYYFLTNGRLLADENIVSNSNVYIVRRILGGKGGFGSMLRAIGAQIEKTTNREACRDLSGRRLRDINEEQRLKNWINQKAEREKEAVEKRQKKLERLCEKPKHEFKDEEYDKARSVLPEIVEDAVLQGLQASCSSKRKAEDSTGVVVKKKPKLWVDDELDEDLSTDEDAETSDSGSKEQVCENLMNVKTGDLPDRKPTENLENM